MLRKILGVLGGVVVAYIVITVSQVISLSMNPFPEGLDYQDKDAMLEYMGTLPASAYALVLGGYVLASLLGGLVATLIAKSKYVPALVIGGFLTLAAIANAMMIPQPQWVSIISVIVMLPMAWLGARLVKTPT